MKIPTAQYTTLINHEHRQAHLERRIEDENTATELIAAACNKYKCFLMNHFDENNTFSILIGTNEPQTPETEENIAKFQKYMMEVLQEYQVVFAPTIVSVNLLTTW